MPGGSTIGSRPRPAPRRTAARLRVAWIAAALVGVAARAAAQDTAAGERGSSLLNARLDAMWSPSGDAREIEMRSLSLGYEHAFRDGFAWLAELELASFDGEPELSGAESDAAGLGLAASLRWYALRRSGWSLFTEFGLGLLGTDGEFPAGGTPLNGYRSVGVGGTLDLGDSLRLVLGVRQRHVSNGRGIVPDNPSWEGSGAFLGLQYELDREPSEPAPAFPFESVEAWPWSLRLEGRAGDHGDDAGWGGLLALDGHVAEDVFVQARASLDSLEGEALGEFGLGAYLRGERGLVGVAFDRQALDVFTDDELSAFAEWYANDLVTVLGVVGYEWRNLSDDRLLGGLTFRVYPFERLALESGFGARAPTDDLAAESLDVPLGAEFLLGSLGAGTWTVFAQDDLQDGARLAGLRCTLGAATRRVRSLRDLQRSTGPLRERP